MRGLQVVEEITNLRSILSSVPLRYLWYVILHCNSHCCRARVGRAEKLGFVILSKEASDQKWQTPNQMSVSKDEEHYYKEPGSRCVSALRGMGTKHEHATRSQGSLPCAHCEDAVSL